MDSALGFLVWMSSKYSYAGHSRAVEQYAGVAWSESSPQTNPDVTDLMLQFARIFDACAADSCLRLHAVGMLICWIVAFDS